MFSKAKRVVKGKGSHELNLGTRPIYYDPQRPITSSLLIWKGTFLIRTLTRSEFWMFQLLHVSVVFAATMNLLPATWNDSELASTLWSSAATVQFFMTFFLTFYNQHCFRRYENLYKESMDCLDGVLLFVHELTISLNQDDLETHRIVATKYALSSLYIFFMTITGGHPTYKEWKEIVSKGLLTQVESDILRDYAGDETPLVLLCWAMVVIDEALEQDCLWKDFDSQHVHYSKKEIGSAHIHNRAREHITEVMRSMHRINHIMGLPIPFTYYHLMGMVLILNFFLAGCTLALFKSFWTTIPFGMVLMLFMGLREVATQLADPFGADDIDFPVEMFINYVFEHSFCLLECFARYDTNTLQRSIDSYEGFSDRQLMTTCDRERLYQQAGVTLNKGFQWQNVMPLADLEDEQDAVNVMSRVLRPKFQEGELLAKAKRRYQVLNKNLQHEDAKLQALRNEIQLLQTEVNRRSHDKDEEARKHAWSKVGRPSSSHLPHLQDQDEVEISQIIPTFRVDQPPLAHAHRDFQDARSRVRDIRRDVDGGDASAETADKEFADIDGVHHGEGLSNRDHFEAATHKFRQIREQMHHNNANTAAAIRRQSTAEQVPRPQDHRV